MTRPSPDLPAGGARRQQSLRSTLLVAVSVLAVIALATAVALMVITSRLHAQNGELLASVEGVRRAEQVVARLLLHARAPDAATRERAAVRVEEGLAEARGYVTSAEEGMALMRAEDAVRRYLAAERSGATDPDLLRVLEAAFTAVDALAEVTVAQAHEAEARGHAWDRVANALGIASAVALIGTAGLLAWWLRLRAFRPILALARTMERYSGGAREVRAPEAGPSEIAVMARSFNGMAEALERQRQALAAFIGGAAHDLRNPLSALKLAARSVAPDRPLPSEPKVRHILAVVERQAERLERMLGDLVDMARIEGGALELRVGEVDLREVIAGAIALLEDSSPRHPIHGPTPGPPVPVRCDPLRIEQVLVNLLGNALKYSPEGGPVTVELEPGPGAVAVAVSDQGIGIVPGEEQLIFEPFRRSRRVPSHVPGAGLGLHAAKRIVEAHGGAIRVENRAGGGARFTVTLPAPDSHFAARAAATNGRAASALEPHAVAAAARRPR